MQTLKNFWLLAQPFWTSSERGVALWLVIATILANLSLVGVSVLTNFWNLNFYNALQDLDYPGFVTGIIQFAGLQLAMSAFTMAGFHFQQKLTIRWRRWATTHLVQDWLTDRRYYKVQLANPEMDNPDQRIAEDVNLFITISLKLSLGLLTAVVSLFSFLHILWAASGLMQFNIQGQDIVIPGILVWAAILYSILGTGGVFWLGKRLPRLNFLQQRKEADYRFALIRLRENAETIALYQGEPEERQRLGQRLETALQNYWMLVKRQKIVLGYSTFYSRSAVVVPFVLLAPQFFAGAIPLGRLTQTSAAFEEVQGATAYLVEVFPELAEWKAVIDRLTGFRNQLQSIDPEGGVALTQQAEGMALDNLKVWLPEGKSLISGLSLMLQEGERLLIRAPSGFGKSTLLRAVTGMWPHASGSASYNHGNSLVLGQKPYLPLGSLRDALCYPRRAEVTHEELKPILAVCGLSHLLPELDRVANWSQILSVGEQQRCAFVRALIIRPQVLFMDESTSALDPDSEAHLYQHLTEKLAHSILISIGHRPALEHYHTHLLDLARGVMSPFSPPATRYLA